METITVDVAVLRQDDGILWAEEARASNQDATEETEVRGWDVVLCIRRVELQEETLRLASAWKAARAIDDLGDTPAMRDLLMEMFAEGFEAGMQYKEAADKPLIVRHE